MKSEIPLHIKIALVVLTVLFLLLVNPFSESKKGKLQNDFDTWLKASREMLFNSPDGLPLEISLRSEAPPRLFSWRLQASENPRKNEKILRLLYQAREANLFNMTDRKPGEVVFEVKDQDAYFISRFNFSDIKNNVKAAVFLQLFEEYAKKNAS